MEFSIRFAHGVRSVFNSSDCYNPTQLERELSLDSNKVKLIDGWVHFAWKPFKKFNHQFRANAKERIIQCRFIPKGSHYVMEIVYEIDTVDYLDYSDRNWLNIQNYQALHRESRYPFHHNNTDGLLRYRQLHTNLIIH